VFPSDYPQHPPKVIPQTEIYHINLKRGMNISVSILGDDWSTYLNVSKILLTIQAILEEPDIQSPISRELLDVYE
jgi:ubiquitin-protein ligase